MLCPKKREKKYIKQFAASMNNATDEDLAKVKEELISDLQATKKKKALIAIEKRIEVIEDIERARGLQDASACGKKCFGKRGNSMERCGKCAIAVGALVAVTAVACAYYIKVNDVRFPDLVDVLADMGIDL